MALPHGVLPREERAKQVAKELKGERMPKKKMAKMFRISPKTVDLVYEIQGHKAFTKKEIAMMAAEKTRKRISSSEAMDMGMYRPNNINYLTILWN